MSRIVYSTSTESAAAERAAATARRQHAAIVTRMVRAADDADYRLQFRRTTGRCTACGSREVALNHAGSVGTDGELTGWGCEVCD